MKIRGVILLSGLLFVLKTQAASIQFISIGVNGLTCSMCTRSVEMSIRKLDFVDSVVMDLVSTEGKIFIAAGTTPDFRAIAKAVTDAGFSVRFMRISGDFKALHDFEIFADSVQKCFFIKDILFSWIGNKVENAKELVLIGDEFMPRKEALAYRKKMNSECPFGKPSYYVTGR
jgi:copper chaperone CopZ